MTPEDAKSTIRFAIRHAIAGTAHLTGLRAGETTEVLIDAIFEEITSPSIAWAWRMAQPPAQPLADRDKV